MFFFIVFVPSIILSQTPLTNAPNFSAIDAQGNNQNLYSYLDSGKFVLLYFFYDTCFVSQTNVPEVDNACIKFGCNTNDVLFLGINFSNTDGEVVSFENNYGLHFPNVSGIDGGGNEIVSLFQVIAFPSIILIAPDRSIPKQDIWPLSSVNIIDELLSSGVDTISCPYAAISHLENASQFQIFPNPVKDYLNISNFSNEENLTIDLFDFLGKKVITQNTSRFNKKAINVSHLNSGIYLLRISKPGEILHSEKIILL